MNTLSGGESQRLKLVRHLSETEDGKSETGNGLAKSSLFIFDEPTTGLHFDDVALLVKVFQRLVDAGNTIVVIEHNLEVMKCADWIIDLGPEAGDEGGKIVAIGTPEEIARVAESHTGRFLRGVLDPRSAAKAVIPSEREGPRIASNGFERSFAYAQDDSEEIARAAEGFHLVSLRRAVTTRSRFTVRASTISKTSRSKSRATKW